MEWGRGEERLGPKRCEVEAPLRKLPGVGPSWGAGPEPLRGSGGARATLLPGMGPQNFQAQPPPRRKGARGAAPAAGPRVAGTSTNTSSWTTLGRAAPSLYPWLPKLGRGPGAPKACGLCREPRAASPPFGWSLTSECGWRSAGDLEAKLPAARCLEELSGSESEVQRRLLQACGHGPLRPGR